MSLILVEQEKLAAALGRIQALVLGCALKETAHIVCTDPVALTWGLEKLVSAGLIAAADYASLRHVGVEVDGVTRWQGCGTSARRCVFATGEFALALTVRNSEVTRDE